MPFFAELPLLVCVADLTPRHAAPRSLGISRQCGLPAVAIVRFPDDHEEARCQSCLSRFARDDLPNF